VKIKQVKRILKTRILNILLIRVFFTFSSALSVHFAFYNVFNTGGLKQLKGKEQYVLRGR